MLHKILAIYLNDIMKAVQELREAHIERYEEEILTPERFNLRIRIRFSNEYLFEANEAVIVERGKLKHLGYRYHCQDQKNFLCFRYDDTPHFPNLPGFPHHKHLPEEVIAVVKPTLLEAIAEAQRFAQ